MCWRRFHELSLASVLPEGNVHQRSEIRGQRSRARTKDRGLEDPRKPYKVLPLKIAEIAEKSFGRSHLCELRSVPNWTFANLSTPGFLRSMAWISEIDFPIRNPQFERSIVRSPPTANRPPSSAPGLWTAPKLIDQHPPQKQERQRCEHELSQVTPGGER